MKIHARFRQIVGIKSKQSIFRGVIADPKKTGEPFALESMLLASSNAASVEIRPKQINVLAKREKAGSVAVSDSFAQTAKMMSGARAPTHSHQCHVVTRK